MVPNHVAAPPPTQAPSSSPDGASHKLYYPQIYDFKSLFSNAREEADDAAWGFQEGSSILITGQPGTGKSFFALSLARGVLFSELHKEGWPSMRKNLPVVYLISGEFDVQHLERDFSETGWFEETDPLFRDWKHALEPQFVLISARVELNRPVPTSEELINSLLVQLRERHSLRAPGTKAFVIVDSLTALLRDCRDVGEERRQTHELIRRLEEALGPKELALAIFLAELPRVASPSVGVEEYVLDTVFRLDLERSAGGRRLRTLEVIKSHGVLLHLGRHTWAILCGDGAKAVVSQPAMTKAIANLALGIMALDDFVLPNEQVPTPRPGRKWATIVVFSQGSLRPIGEQQERKSPEVNRERIVSGIPGFDQMLEFQPAGQRYWTNRELGLAGPEEKPFAGLVPGSTTVVVGSAGAGKTTMCLQFLLGGWKEGRRPPQNQESLYINFESPWEEILENFLRKRQIQLEKIHRIYRRRGNLDLGALLTEVRFICRNHSVSRIAIDGLSSLLATTTEAEYSQLIERMLSTIRGLSSERKEKGPITLFITYEPARVSDGRQTDLPRLSALADNLLIVNDVMIEDEVRHAVMLTKARGQAHDRTVREIRVHGNDFLPLSIEAGLESYTGLLREDPKPVKLALQLFYENQHEELYNRRLEKRLQDVFNYRVKIFGYSRAAISRTLRELASTETRLPASHIRVLTLDEWVLGDLEGRSARQKPKVTKPSLLTPIGKRLQVLRLRYRGRFARLRDAWKVAKTMLSAKPHRPLSKCLTEPAGRTDHRTALDEISQVLCDIRSFRRRLDAAAFGSAVNASPARFLEDAGTLFERAATAFTVARAAVKRKKQWKADLTQALDAIHEAEGTLNAAALPLMETFAQAEEAYHAAEITLKPRKRTAAIGRKEEPVNSLATIAPALDLAEEALKTRSHAERKAVLATIDACLRQTEAALKMATAELTRPDPRTQKLHECLRLSADARREAQNATRQADDSRRTSVVAWRKAFGQADTQAVTHTSNKRRLTATVPDDQQECTPPLLPLSPFHDEIRNPQLNTRAKDFWFWDLKKGIGNWSTVSKDGQTKADTPTLLALPLYVDYGMFCVNAALANVFYDIGLPARAENYDRCHWEAVLMSTPRFWATKKDTWFQVPQEDGNCLVDWMAKARDCGPEYLGFVFDMATPETAANFFLELCWAFGATSHVFCESTGSAWDRKNQEAAEWAMRFIMFLVAEDLMPATPSIDQAKSSFFSRHFYSTFCDCVCPRRPDSKSVSRDKPASLVVLPFQPVGSPDQGARRVLDRDIVTRRQIARGLGLLRRRVEPFREDWRSVRRKLSDHPAPRLPVAARDPVTKFPVSEADFRDELEFLKRDHLRRRMRHGQWPVGNGSQFPTGHCCSGAWMVAVHGHTHSAGLSYKLIDEMTSLDSVAERARMGAGMPARKDFYDYFGDEPVKFAPYLTWSELLTFCGSRSRQRQDAVRTGEASVRDMNDALHESTGAAIAAAALSKGNRRAAIRLASLASELVSRTFRQLQSSGSRSRSRSIL